jgi:hypothetical protein
MYARMKMLPWFLASVLMMAMIAMPDTSAARAKASYGIGAPGLLAGRDYVAGQVIVGLLPGASLKVPPQARVVGQIPGTALLLELPSEETVFQAIPGLLANPHVSFVERNGFLRIPPLASPKQKDGQRPHISDPLTSANAESAMVIQPQAVSGDPGAAYQWHLRVIRKSASLGTLSTTPPTIAIIDTGVDYTHADLATKVIKGKNCIDDNSDPYDDHGHGTHVAGLAAATAANGQYGEGVSHFSKILAIKVLNEDGSGTFFQIACGMHFGHQASTSPATRVGNMSLGGPASALIATEVDHWKAAGKLLVVAAGNDDSAGDGSFNVDPDIGLRVMATEENDCRTFFSNFSLGTNPTLFNIAAPGWETPSTLPDEQFGALSGTSMASPIVAGAAALVWGQFPSLTRDQLIARLINNGRAITCGFAAPTRRVDVRRAIHQTTETVIIGRVLDGATAKPPSPNTASATVQVRNGTTVLGSGQKQGGGWYSAFGSTIAGTGRNLFFTGMTGYLNDTIRQPLTVLNGTPTGPLVDAISKSRPTGYFHGTIDWKTAQPSSPSAGANTLGWDLDLGMRLPDGTVFPFGPAGDLSAPPFVLLHRDSFLDLEPVESFLIGPSAANGTYKIAIDRVDGPASLTLNESRAQVQFLNAAARVLFLNAPACTGGNPIWHVANVVKSGTSYAVTTVNACVASFPE